MKKAGGILGIIGGVFSVVAALVTLFIGGVGGAFQASGADTVIGLGWGGLAFALLTIIFGAVSLGARSRTPGVLLSLSALGGAILGGTMVAVCMVLALVGGLLAALGAKPEPVGAPLAPAAIPARRRGKPGKMLGVVGAVVVVGLVAIGLASKPGHRASQTASSTPTTVASTGQTQEPAATESMPAAAASSSPPPAFQVGETFATQRFHVTLTSATVKHSVGDLLTSKAPAGAEYVAVAWRYTNRSSAPISVFAVPSLHLLDAQGHRYDADLEASSFYAAQIQASAKALSDVNPGITLTDGAVFEVSTAQFNPATWTLQVHVDGQDVIVRFPPQTVAGVATASPQPVASVASEPQTAAATASTSAAMTAEQTPVEGKDMALSGTIAIGHGKFAAGRYTYLHADQPFISPCGEGAVQDVMLWNPEVGDSLILQQFAGQHVVLHGVINCPMSGIQFSPDSASQP
ncbi:MAG: DUF4352 domain-containing protein [Thiomonas arsenitoxydans]|uniref:DUF4352 domain-containing protein n=2 Tax=Thiomonas arsenitoxydans (strain DSM 22701 / CIP 110005 / 3As) TaxID=426114 RepID=A0A8I1MXS7_THIA3|nr:MULTISPECIES: DUF4352 domain-containing protein [Thiomonas]MBN8744526.1 DUF4352 domain-containing protein [Thiomonas arsenitoxydans]ODU96986.1 MAG: hypothetical protein ABT24_06795 [Thiomonas sp. SCN 64-16]